MWHPHVRFSMRRMIIVVAVLALIFGAFHRKRRSDEFRQRAARHLQFAQPGGSITIMGSPEDLARNLGLIKCYHDKMFKKYEYLAWHPWTSADPDPPPPGFNLIID